MSSFITGLEVKTSWFISRKPGLAALEMSMLCTLACRGGRPSALKPASALPCSPNQPTHMALSAALGGQAPGIVYASACKLHPAGWVAFEQLGEAPQKIAVLCQVRRIAQGLGHGAAGPEQAQYHAPAQENVAHAGMMRPPTAPGHSMKRELV